MPETILLVEDKDVLREMVQVALTQAGHEVEEAPDGVTALAKIRSKRFPIIITDLKLPGPSGLDILRAAKELDESVAVLIMTAFGSVDEAVTAMKEGALDFIQKPFELPHLLLLVKRALEDQARLRVNLDDPGHPNARATARPVAATPATASGMKYFSVLV